MWKQLTAALLTLAFTASTFCRIAIVLDYYTNTVAYAKNCVNKSSPLLHCNGKCQMMKKLEQEERKEQDNQARKPEAKSEQVATTYFCQDLLSSISTVSADRQNRPIEKPIDRTYTLLRPPTDA